MSELINLSILTPNKEVFKGEVKEILTESQSGKIGILPNHINMITILKPSNTEITLEDGKKIIVSNSQGIFKIEENYANIICDEATIEK